jgi:hypothetical protein
VQGGRGVHLEGYIVTFSFGGLLYIAQALLTLMVLLRSNLGFLHLFILVEPIHPFNLTTSTRTRPDAEVAC